MKYILLLLFAFNGFSQQKPILITIDKITTEDSIFKRISSINYSIENKSDNSISFLLNPERFSPSHTNSMGTNVFYKLFQKDEELKTTIFSHIFQKPIDFPDLEKIENDEERQKVYVTYMMKKYGIDNEELKKDTINGMSFDDAILKKPSKKLLNSIFTLSAKEKREYSTIFYWDKKRYFKQDDYEYYLDEKADFYLQFCLILMKEEYKVKMTTCDFEELMKVPNFLKGVITSEKVEINLKE